MLLVLFYFYITLFLEFKMMLLIMPVLNLMSGESRYGFASENYYIIQWASSTKQYSILCSYQLLHHHLPSLKAMPLQLQKGRKALIISKQTPSRLLIPLSTKAHLREGNFDTGVPHSHFILYLSFLERIQQSPGLVEMAWTGLQYSSN